MLKENGRNYHGEVAWECLCDCGNIVTVGGYDLRSGNTKSCGCYKHERIVEASTTHGAFGTPLYRTYFNMKNRCYNPHYYLFQHYGGKGVTVCDEWLGSGGFSAFAAWSNANGYERGLSIDRLDNSKGYCPDNCRWVNMVTQQNNRTNNRLITVDGETHTMAEWAKISGLHYGTIQRRLANGWSDSEAVTLRPSHASRRSRADA